MYELHPNQSQLPETTNQSNHEITPSIPLTLFEQALLKPLPDFTPITIAEIQMMGRHSKDDISTHFLTSLLLRLTGDYTSIKDFEEYSQAGINNEIINKKVETSVQTKNYYNDLYEQAADKIKNYILIKKSVTQYRYKYLNVYEKCVDATAQREFTDSIYEASDHFKHPGLTYLEAQRHQPREEIRTAVIESERLLRSMLIDAASDNGTTT